MNHGPRGGENPPAHGGTEPENAEEQAQAIALAEAQDKAAAAFIVRLTV